MSALDQLVAHMTVAQLADAAGLSVDELVALVLRRSRARGGTSEDGGGRRGRSPEPLLPRAGEIVVDAVAGSDARGPGSRRRAARPRKRASKRGAKKTKRAG